MDDIENEYQVQIKDTNEEDEANFPTEVVIIPIMNSPIFPGMIAPIILSEEMFIPELDKQLFKSGYVALNLVKATDDKSKTVDHYDEQEEMMDITGKRYLQSWCSL